ncbi:ATP-binding cassette domain-containing protein [Oenococcus kitaharae]|uniref:ABC transporter ATP-binding protein n=1 Tax=Oenococcus kitaharae DSM 17330 TaxID=1045004 RepID=G9WJ71_9LACO|nr:ATP-binding cassette domain-containing protein [Oenococcus kitaharae]EHN58520.1 ABC transporter ATP-binding protein [Oenococcus kitaharae DSM 17330]OEY81334.1 ABC transporter [Oenococcus kitaharae]OEY82822.1 ABC transporter [Oenococcus kitaharae]OEY84634.1 ABC transporter [Oenococcus kitaharae]
MSGDILQINHLSFSYRSKLIYDEANLEITKVGIYGLVAPNGSGKTTLLNLVANLLAVKNGRIDIFGQKDTPDIFFNYASFLQDNRVLYPYLTAREHLNFVCEQHHVDQKKIETVAHVLGMSNYIDQKIISYSLGMKQRLLLGLAIITKPQLILMDEPLNGLDPTSLAIVRKVVTELRDQGSTLLISSHNLDELNKITKNVFFVKGHKILLKELNNQESTEKVYEELYMNLEDFDV